MSLPALVLGKSSVSSATATANSNNLSSRSYLIFFGAAYSEFASLTPNGGTFRSAFDVRRSMFGVFLLVLISISCVVRSRSVFGLESVWRIAPSTGTSSFTRPSPIPRIIRRGVFGVFLFISRRWLEHGVVALRVGGENILHIWFDPPFTYQFQIRKRPVRLPDRDQPFRIGRINSQCATAQGNAQNLGKISQPDQRRHHRI